MTTVEDPQAQSSGTPLIFAGHSHIIALVENRDCTPPELRKLGIGANTFVLDGTWPRDDAYWARLVGECKDADIALMWGGNEHNSCYFFQDAYQFDFLSTYVNKIMPSIQIVPRNRIAKRFNELTLNQLDTVLASLRAAGPRSITLLGTPAPKKDNEALRAMLPSEPFFVDWANDMGTSIEDIKITLPHVRLKLWYLLQEMLQAAAARVNARFISVPAESQDEDGYLLPQYWQPDITHANASYGEVMLKKVLKELGHG
jgi:hypothetical protein